MQESRRIPLWRTAPRPKHDLDSSHPSAAGMSCVLGDLQRHDRESGGLSIERKGPGLFARVVELQDIVAAIQSSPSVYASGYRAADYATACV